MLHAFRYHTMVAPLLMSLGASAPYGPIADSTPGSIELRFAQTTLSPKLIPWPNQRGPQRLFVEREAAVSADDIQHVTVLQEGNRVVFRIVLTDSADARLAQQSVRRLGDFVALIVEGRLVAAWEIVGRLGGTLTRRHTIGVEMAAIPRGSAKRVAGRWPAK